jgi:hypothetical protein
MRRFGPPYPTDDWDATITIGELCSNDDPRGMLAWAALNYDPAKRGEQDVDDRLAGLLVELYARVAGLDHGLALEPDDLQRLVEDTARVQEIVNDLTAVKSLRRSA